ncbi:MAG: DUF2269 family protein [Chloroflexota bacterium]
MAAASYRASRGVRPACYRAAMAQYYGLIVILHVIAVMVFILVHGVSMVTAFQLRGVTERSRAVQLLDRSQLSVGLMYAALLVLLVAGIAAGFIGAHWSRLWIWASIGVLVAVLVVMWAVASPYYMRLRQALGTQQRGDSPTIKPISDDEMATRLRSMRPMWLAVVGLVGLIALFWLMFAKPF